MSGGLVTRNVEIISQGANGQTISGQANITANDEVNLSQTVPVGTNTEYAITFAHATLQSIDLFASEAMTLKFNSTGSPAPTIVLAAGQMIHWDVTEYAANSTLFPNPFSADVTAVFVTAAVSGVLDISAALLV